MRKRSSSNKRLPFMRNKDDENSEGDSSSLANDGDQVLVEEHVLVDGIVITNKFHIFIRACSTAVSMVTRQWDHP
jgi:hypothetical protein